MSLGARRLHSGFARKQNARWELTPTVHCVLATSYSRTAYRRTTIGAAAFHCRVRNGNGWGHCAIVTRGTSRTDGFGASRRRGSLGTMSIFQRTADSLISTYRAFEKAHLRLRFVLRSFVSSVCHPACAGWVNRKVKDQAERVISTPELNMLPCLHPEPINVVVYHDPSGRTHLGIGLALRCFQRLSFPNIATQHCS